MVHITTSLDHVHWALMIYDPFDRLTHCIKHFFVCLGFFVLLEKFSFIWTPRHHCRWRAANFDLCSVLITIKQWGFTSVQNIFLYVWHLFIMVISEDPSHAHLLPNVSQWSCHYLFLRRRSVAAGFRTPNLPLVRRRL